METTEKASGTRADRFAADEVAPLDISRQEAQAFADAYAFLDIALKLPGKGLATSLQRGQVVESMESIALDLRRFSSSDRAEQACRHFANAQVASACDLSSLRSSYTTLFTNPLGAKLYIHEAQFLYYQKDPDADVGLSPRMFVNPAALSVERIVKKAGLSRNDKSNESADHLATEVELASRLFAEKAALREAAEADGALDGSTQAPEHEAERALDAVIRELSYYHCAKWHREFFEQLAASGVHEFFDGLGCWGQFVTEALMAL